MSGPTGMPPNAEAKGLRLSGQRAAGFFRLVAHVDLSVNPGGRDRRVVVVPLGGDLSVQGAGGNAHVVAHLTPTGNAPILDMVGMPETRTVAFCGDLDAARLKAIEDIRSNGDLIFTARVFGTLAYQYDFFRTYNINTEARKTVNQADWAQLREQMGAGRTMLIEVAEPDAERFPAMAEAVRHWRQAWGAYQRRDPSEAVGDCRLALEALMQALEDRDTAPVDAIYNAEVQALFQGQNAMTKEERLRLVRRALRVLCHPPHHVDKVSAAINWERKDAEFVLSAVAALLGSCVERTP